MAERQSDELVALMEEPIEEFEPARARISGVVLARIVAVQAPDRALVTWQRKESAGLVSARSLPGLGPADVGCDVALMFEAGDPDRPLIMGRLEEPPSAGSGAPLSIAAEAITIIGEQEIVLRCGHASVTLRKDGRVAIRGGYVETRSRGVNRIKGGSVQIN